jgi:restriction endonuclease Mrr
MKMRENSDQELLRFLADIIEDLIEGKTQVRFSRPELLKVVGPFVRKAKIASSPPEVLEGWAKVLNHSVFVKNYVVKYIPAVDSLSFQWVPPWENIAWAAEVRNMSVKQELRETIAGLSFDEFEHLMRQVFDHTNWARDIAVTKVSHDDGIDFEGKFVERSSGLLLPLVGQAKHWKAKVGSEEIRTFLGSIAVRNDHRMTVGVYVSTNGFTDDGLRMIRKAPNQIIWFDLDKLADLMIANRVGVSMVSVKGLGLDSGFWNDLQA